MDEKAEKVSVIVPIYNTEKYLKQCIDSILNQTYKNIEIILVDDGSTDNSCSICDYFWHRYENIICIHEKNNGSVKARKTGIWLASGKYIVFVDSDDYIENNFIEELVLHISLSDAEFVHSGFAICKDKEERIIVECQEGVFNLQSVESKSKFICDFFSYGKLGLTPSIWSKIFQKEFIKDCFEKVPTDQQYGEDIICLMSCIEKANKVKLINKALYNYRVREESLSHTGKGKYLKSEMGLLKSLITFFDGSELGLFLQDELYGYLVQRIGNILNNIATPNFYIPCFYFKDIRKLCHNRIVLYGAGKVGMDYYRQFSVYRTIDIVLWIDKKYMLYNLDYFEISPVNSIVSCVFDYVVIAVSSIDTSLEIKQELTRNGVEEEKILWDTPCKYIQSSL